MVLVLDVFVLMWVYLLVWYDYKFMIKNVCICYDFVLCFFVFCCGFLIEKYVRMDVWYYYLEIMENWEDL